MRWYLFALIIVIAGCRGGRERNAADALPGPVGNVNGENDAAPLPDQPRVPVLELGAGGEDAALGALAAVPVWEAVINRGDYLARRRKQGVIHGRVGAPVGRYIYFVDETEGWGALAVRMSSTAAAALEPGQRLVVWGAWSVDDELGWYWQAQKIASLPARDSGIPPGAEAAPGLDIVTIAEPPAEAVPVSMRTRDPGYIVFEMVRMGGDPSQGWEISDRSDWQPVARLFLPGERTVYGAQDYRSPSEHWRLERGVRYVVRVDRSAAPKADVLVRLTALDAPRRLGE